MKNITFLNDLIKEIKYKPKLKDKQEQIKQTRNQNQKDINNLINEMLIKRQHMSINYQNLVNLKNYQPNSEYTLNQLKQLIQFDSDIKEPETKPKKTKSESELNQIDNNTIKKSKSQQSLIDIHLNEVKLNRERILNDKLNNLYKNREKKKLFFNQNRNNLKKKQEKENEINEFKKIKKLKLKIKGIIQKYEKKECKKFINSTHTMNEKVRTFFKRSYFYKKKENFHDIFHYNKNELGYAHDPFSHIMEIETNEGNEQHVLDTIKSLLKGEDAIRFSEQPDLYITDKRYCKNHKNNKKSLFDIFNNEGKEEQNINKPLIKNKTQSILIHKKDSININNDIEQNDKKKENK